MDSSSTLNSTPTNALSLAWAFGFNKDVVDSVHSLCGAGREALFYVAAHTGVIYDYTKRTQELLQVCGLVAIAFCDEKGKRCSSRSSWLVTALHQHTYVIIINIVGFGLVSTSLCFHVPRDCQLADNKSLSSMTCAASSTSASKQVGVVTIG